MVSVTVDGKDYQLNEQQINAMVFVQESIAIAEKGAITINTIDQKTFEFILNILETLHYNIATPPKVTTNVVNDVIGNELNTLIGKLDAKEINSLYKAAHFLKISNLRHCIAAVMACRVYIKPTLTEYNNKKAEVGLTHELNTETSKNYKERFPWMN